MQINRKSIQQAEELGGALRQRRLALGFTLEQLASSLQIDAGQLSRFERAKFKFVSKNLQKAVEFLQIAPPREQEYSNTIVQQFVEVLGRSERHRAAAIALVRALQELR